LPALPFVGPTYIGAAKRSSPRISRSPNDRAGFSQQRRAGTADLYASKMALVNAFAKHRQTTYKRHPTTIECRYGTFAIESDRYIQLNTCGSTGKTSTRSARPLNSMRRAPGS
jgi:hypothetical protein